MYISFISHRRKTSSSCCIWLVVVVVIVCLDFGFISIYTHKIVPDFFFALPAISNIERFLSSIDLSLLLPLKPTRARESAITINIAFITHLRLFAFFPSAFCLLTQVHTNTSLLSSSPFQPNQLVEKGAVAAVVIVIEWILQDVLGVG